MKQSPMIKRLFVTSLCLAYFICSVPLFAAVRDETQSIGDTTNNDMIFPESLNSVQTAFNKSKESANVAVFKYSPENAYKIRLRTAIETLFILPPGETIVSYSIGDSLVFNYKPIIAKNYATGNLFTVRPIAAGADTNLVIVGSSGKIYKFYLRSDNHKSAFLPHFVVYVSLDGSIPDLGALKLDENVIGEPQNGIVHFASGKVNLSEANFGYVTLKGGDKKLAPAAVFDDGRFTYFQYRQKRGEPRNLPVVYRVADGYDTPVNSRVEGDYLIAETISERWTLRAGESHLCVAQEGK
jgi:type IV secretory pathway VirB9-like protein